MGSIARRATLKPTDLAKKHNRRDSDSPDSHRAQLLWTFCVVIAVAASALLQVGNSKGYRLPRDSASTGVASEASMVNRRAQSRSINPEREPAFDGRPGVFSE